MASLTDIYSMPNLPTGGWMGGQTGYPDTTPTQPGRPLYGTNMPTIQPTAPAAWTPTPMNAGRTLDQAGYFAQNPDAGFGDWLNYTQGKTAGGEFQAPDASSLPPGFMQSEYGPAWQSVLAQFNDPNYNKNEDPNNLSSWLGSSQLAFARGDPLSKFTGPTTSGTIGGLDPATIAQLAVGGFGGAAMGAGVGSTAGVGGGAGGATAGTAGSVVDAGAAGGAATGATGAGAITGTDIAGAGAAAGAVSPALTATQDPLGSGGDPGNPISGGAGSSGGAAGAGSALSRIIDGTATPADWTSVLGGVAGTGLGIAGSISQQNALKDLADKQMAMGAPYRDRLAALYADPNSFLKSAEVTTPVQQGTDALARSLSVQGNPIGSGHALQELQNYSANQLFSKLGAEKDRLAGYGGLTAYNAAAPGTSLAATNAGSNVWNAVGSGIANLTNPQPSLIDLYKAMKGLA